MDGPRRHVIGLGHDLQLISEVAAATGLREPDVFFTAGELRRFASSVAPLETQAGAFAAKEALFKALPPTGETWFWTDAELMSDALGKPRFHVHGALARHLTRQRQQVAVSISHSGGFASATVLVTRDSSVVSAIADALNRMVRRVFWPDFIPAERASQRPRRARARQ